MEDLHGESPPEKEPRISSRLSAQSVLSREELLRTVAEVKTAAEEEQARLSHPLPDPVSWWRRPLVAGLLVGVAVAVWAVQLWIWRPPAIERSPRERDASLRFAMALQVARIEDFRAARGRLPTTLSEVAEVYEGMRYVRIDSLRYRLVGADSNLVVTFQSDSSLRALLGSSLMRIRDAKK
ncbi:MAG: hypothetical protein HYX65_12050 [Gemmatimonadetes bacterium]|nr:hypothetical protein [Gemmatimonadota bacterium]